MKTLTIRLPQALLRQIQREFVARGVSKSEIVRERVGQPVRGGMKDLAGDLVGSVRGLPSHLSANKKNYLGGITLARCADELG